MECKKKNTGEWREPQELLAVLNLWYYALNIFQYASDVGGHATLQNDKSYFRILGRLDTLDSELISQLPDWISARKQLLMCSAPDDHVLPGTFTQGEQFHPVFGVSVQEPPQ